jgi:hypothetical protein
MPFARCTRGRRLRRRRRAVAARDAAANAPLRRPPRRSCTNRRGPGSALRRFVPSTLVERGRLRADSNGGGSGETVLAKLGNERSRARVVRKDLECADRVLRPQRQHRAERVRIDADTTEFLQQHVERLVVCHKPPGLTSSVARRSKQKARDAGRIDATASIKDDLRPSA